MKLRLHVIILFNSEYLQLHETEDVYAFGDYLGTAKLYGK